MMDFDEFDVYYQPQVSQGWLYIGGYKNTANQSKIGMTTKAPNFRHTSSQSPDYFIYAAFELLRGDVRTIERDLKILLRKLPNIENISHFSTGSESEVFKLDPDLMTYIVEEFIRNNYSSCVTYQNNTTGDMSRFLCPPELQMFIEQRRGHPNQTYNGQQSLDKPDYFTGNQEVHEIDLGNGHIQDLSTGQIKYDETW
jgi:hypothetical protein